MVVLGLSFGRCGGGGSAGPTQPPVSVPAAPTPAPTPLADPPLSLSCAKLPVGNPNAGCRIEGSDYLEIVDRAIRTLQAEQPAIFEGDIVKSHGAYYVGLIKILDRQGICAEYDGEELAVTDRATSSEQFHVLTSSGRRASDPGAIAPPAARPSCPRRGAGAAAAVPRGLPAALEPRGELRARGRQPLHQGHCRGSRASDEGEAGLFNFDQVAPGTPWPAVKSIPAYHGAVVEAMRKKGYCAKDDGEEIAVKQGSNTVSEQYDINFQDKYVRIGPGIYRASCYPAAF